jgi:hypothetical protein
LPKSTHKYSIEIYFIFSELYFIFYAFLKFIHIPEILKPEKKFEKERTVLGRQFGPRLLPSGGKPDSRPMPTAPCGRAPDSHRASVVAQPARLTDGTLGGEVGREASSRRGYAPGKSMGAAFRTINDERRPAVNREVLLQLEGMEEHVTRNQIKEKGRPWRELTERGKLQWLKM